MATFPFVGQTYTLRSVNYDCQRTVNLYPVASESTSKTPTGLQGTPGLLAFCQPFPSNVRGSHTANGRCWFVIGSYLYEIYASGSYVRQGTLLTAFGPVQMADNGQQLCVVDGDNGYILSMSTSAFSQIVSAGWMGSKTVSYVDGYFIFVKPDSGIYYISNLYEGSVVDPLEFASAEGSPDNLVAAIAVHKEVWLFGNASIEVVFDSGDADFPFQRIQGVFMEYGCSAPFSVAKTANTVFWLGQDTQGAGVVWMATGYQPQRISTFAIEYLLQQSNDLSLATAYTYQEDGHYFYVLNLPDLDTTIVYDIGLQQWHERAYWNLETGQYERHRGSCHAYAFGKHLIGDYENGIIYEQSLNIYDDNGNPKRWMRRCPHLANENELNYFYYNRLQVDMQTGTGLVTGATQDVDPEVMLRWSDDGGHTWSNEHWRSAGKIGNYKRRVYWSRLGRSRDRVFEVSGSTATKTFLIGANIDAQQGAN